MRKITIKKAAVFFTAGCILLLAGLYVSGFLPLFAERKKENALRLVSWNVQAFFDGETTGNEYAEFRGSKSLWSRDKYRDRLERLCEAVSVLDADVLVLQEIENRAVVHDIINNLHGHSFGSKTYRYAVFSAEVNASIGSAVLSRVPLTGFSVHTVLDKVSVFKQPSLRPLMQVGLGRDGCGAGENLALFVCHWKSLSDGNAAAAYWQSWQESILAGRMDSVLKNGGSAVACGDFNRDAALFSEYSDSKTTSYTGRSPNRRLLLRDGSSSVAVYNPWFDTDSAAGSYFFRGDWERIDNFFAAGRICLSDFTVHAEEPFVHTTEEGIVPFRYTIFTGKGYSDHLPIGCFVSFQP